MAVYSSRVGPISSGTVALTFGAVVTLPLSTAAKQIIALIVSGVDATYTTAIGAAGILRVSSESLKIVDVDIPTGPYTSSGPGTNGSGQAMIQDIIPVDWPCEGGERINFSVAPSAANTVARLYEVMVMFADSFGAPADWVKAFPDVVPFKGSKTIAAQQLTVTSTDLTALIVPAWAKEIVAVKCVDLKEGAITAGEECLGYFNMKTTIPGADPQYYPTNGLGATLGTPVGTGMYHDWIPWIPVYLPMRGKDETITPNINMRTAVTTGNNVLFSVAYR